MSLELRAGPDTLVDGTEKAELSTTRLGSDVAIKQEEEGQGNASEGAERYLTGKELVLTFSGLLLALLVSSLDLTIVGTALPTIVSDFDALGQVTWVPTAYLLTTVAFTLPTGQLLSLYPTKYIYILSIVIFELGSLLCAVSTSMNFLIIGRAVAGIGNTAINVCVVWAIAQIARLETRPALFGCIGVIYALSSVLGPLVGGAFTARVTWRWCFYMNLPIGVVTLFISYFMPHKQAPATPNSPATMSTRRKLLEVDWIGFLISLGTVVAFLFPLQFGGNTYPWNSANVIVPLVISVVGLALFLWWQGRMGNRALLPWHVIRRPLVASSFVAFCNFYGLMVGIYYIPLWYQSQGRNAIQSGIDILPLLLSCVGASIVVGAFANATGRYWPVMVICPLFYSIGSGLLYTLNIGSPEGKLIGYQIIAGIGIGSTLQMPEISTQAELAHEEELIPQATGMCSFIEGLGGVVGLAIAGAVFLNQLTSNLHQYAPELPSSVAVSVQQSITYIFTLPASEQGAVVQAYVRTLDQVFLVGVPIGAISSLVSLTCVHNHNLKTRTPTPPPEKEGGRSDTAEL
ncbi:MFS general substrate transporter [Coniophora puteana RWD-64-598 SS2]|uniref:MFS general substrate transporter n=1 Tax=Coniophora puteana (strain RWD-64-598) TaxID=741705 RepID=A0A5M3MCH0_CONPW|nr:MFS general substrate transporter [Coniophora puteana RWD-64-598 SS2]EIW76335.1 MFS general substrate transporter [Coniophora puteana RWD-64-598 SS2]